MKTSTKYDALSNFYDLIEKHFERKSFSKWRKLVWKNVLPTSKVLEVGVGTGKNIPYYPDNVEVVGIDFSQGMLKKATLRSENYPSKKMKLMKMDVTNMVFPEDNFDFVISTFVFCTVPNPAAGLREINRVLKPKGQAIFLEHMRSDRWFYNLPLYMMNPAIKTLVGTSVTRKTKENILKAGLLIVKEEKLFSDIVRLLICKKG